MWGEYKKLSIIYRARVSHTRYFSHRHRYLWLDPLMLNPCLSHFERQRKVLAVEPLWAVHKEVHNPPHIVWYGRRDDVSSVKLERLDRGVILGAVRLNAADVHLCRHLRLLDCECASLEQSLV